MSRCGQPLKGMIYRWHFSFQLWLLCLCVKYYLSLQDLRSILRSEGEGCKVIYKPIFASFCFANPLFGICILVSTLLMKFYG